MFRKTIVMTLLLFLSISISAPSFAETVDLKHDNTFLTTIVRYYDSWDECNEVGEKLKVNDIQYSLDRTYLMETQNKVKAIYSIPTSFKITYSSWDDCKTVGESLVENNITYYLTKAERVTGTEKFIATYTIDR